MERVDQNMQDKSDHRMHEKMHKMRTRTGSDLLVEKTCRIKNTHRMTRPKRLEDPQNEKTCTMRILAGLEDSQNEKTPRMKRPKE